LQKASYNVSTDTQIRQQNEHVAEIRKGDQLHKKRANNNKTTKQQQQQQQQPTFMYN
jgi:hypothetical protein